MDELGLVRRHRPTWLDYLCRAENLLVVAILAAMVILPIAEIALRRLFGVGIKGSIAYVQHLTLMVGMLGGAIAARENRLLSLSTIAALLPEKWRGLVRILSHGLAAVVSAVLTWASWDYVMQLRPSSEILPYGVKVWWIQMSLPIGFAAVTLRLLWHSGETWKTRLAGLLLAAALVGFLVTTNIAPSSLVWPGMGLLLIATVCGAPIFALLAGAALLLLGGISQTLTVLPLNHYDLVTDFVLPSIPLFTLTGYLLAEGGASKRLVRLFDAAFRGLRGGPAIVTAVVCAFFTSFTGASGVTILALGGLLMPVLLAAGYKERSAMGLLTGAGSLGLMFPPCLPLILYAVIAQRTISYMEVPASGVTPEVTIEALFLAGIVPGFLLVALTAGWGIWQAPKHEQTRKKFDGHQLMGALWAAKWEMLLPIGALLLILMGWATPVEAAAATALYAFLVEVVIHRDLKMRDLPRVVTECALLVGGVLLILGVAMGLTAYLIYEDIPTQAVAWTQKGIESKWVFLLLLNIFLLGVGCLMDIFSALVVVVPLIVPLGLAFGVDPVHLGIIFLANMELGYLTPPVGMNLFLASYRFNKPVSYVARAVLPMLGVLLVGVLLITYLPWLTLALPRWLK
jgi:tripartite ATP-independent transporter DctM subunit